MVQLLSAIDERIFVSLEVILLLICRVFNVHQQNYTEGSNPLFFANQKYIRKAQMPILSMKKDDNIHK